MKEYIAVVQMDCVVGDMRENTENIIRLLSELRKEEKHVLLAVFPEMCLYGYARFSDIATQYTQAVIEHFLDKIMEVCVRDQIDAVVGAPYIDGDKVENALYYISMKGTREHVYSKMHLIADERDWFRPGDSYGLCQTTLGRIGFLICYDLSFAETARLYATAGAELIIASAAWEMPYERQWEVAVCARAFDNGIPVVASNRIGTDESVTFLGESMIADGMGNLLARIGQAKEGYLMCEKNRLFDKEKIEEFGSPVNALRKDTYTMKNIKFYLL